MATFELKIEYTAGGGARSVRAIVQEANLSAACKLAGGMVTEKFHKPAEAVAGKSIDETIVMILDGQKPVWLSKTASREHPGQTKIEGPTRRPGNGRPRARIPAPAKP